MPSAPDARPSFDGQVAFDGYEPDDERRRESLLGLGNGVLFVRDWLPGAEPGDDHHYAGTYRAGCYNRRDVIVAGQSLGHDSLVNLPNWLPLTFRAAGEPEWFAWRSCDVLELRRTLDVERGLVEWRALVRDAQGRRTRMAGQRLVSMADPMLAALHWQLTPENWGGVIEIRAAIDGRVVNANTDRASLPGYRHLDSTPAHGDGHPLLLRARTHQSRLEIAVATRTSVDAPCTRTIERGAEILSCPVALGATLSLEKVAAIVTARDPAVSEAGEAARLRASGASDFVTLREAHVRVWTRLWERAAIEADDPGLGAGLALHAFHLLQTVSPHSVQIDVGLPSRGWQEAYHGQIFWDEIFAVPFLNHRFPEIARGLLLYRYRRLNEARRAARAAGYAGAMFPWRSASTGVEETPSLQPNPLTGGWHPDHTRLQRHVGSAVAHNAWTYALTTGDDSFVAEYGAELMVEIARFWASIARRDPHDGRFDISGVIGPDEYHDAYPDASAPGLDNNAYTNVMAAATLRRAAATVESLDAPRRGELSRALGLAPAEIALWRSVASRLRLCLQPNGIISQFAGFERLRPPEALAHIRQNARGRLDWELEARGDTINAYQMSKQPDVLMLLYLFPTEELIELLGFMGYPIDRACLRRTASYYLDRISHESSLSRVICAGALAPLDPEASWAFFQRSLCIDFDISNSASAEQGLHLGAMSGTLDVLQRHYLGLRLCDEALLLDPAPPPSLGPVRMRVRHRGSLLALEWDGQAVRLRVESGGGLTVQHAGRPHHLATGEMVTAQVHAAPPVPPRSGTAAPDPQAATAGGRHP